MHSPEPSCLLGLRMWCRAGAGTTRAHTPLGCLTLRAPSTAPAHGALFPGLWGRVCETVSACPSPWHVETRKYHSLLCREGVGT